MYMINNNTVIDFGLSRSLKAYFQDEYKNYSFTPAEISSITNSTDIIISHNSEKHLFNTIEN